MQGFTNPVIFAPDRQTSLPIKEGAGATGCPVHMTREITAGKRKRETFSSRANMYNLRGKNTWWPEITRLY